MNVKKIAPLVVALILGGIAAKMAFNFVRNRSQNTSEAKRTQIVIAKRNLDAGQVLSPDDLTMGDVVSEAVPDTVFTSPDQLLGRVTVVPLIQGQAITTTLLAPRGVGPGLQATVPIGMRAVTVDISEITGVAGYLVPGCHVDLIQTLKDLKTGFPVARTLAQNVKIIAVGVKHNPQDGDASGGGRSVTLLVSPEQTELVELASQIGRTRLSLRSGNDLALTDTKSYTIAELIGDHTPRADDFDEVEPVITRAPTTQPMLASNAATRPSYDLDNDQWIIQIIRGGNESEAKFAVPRYGNQLGETDQTR